VSTRSIFGALTNTSRLGQCRISHRETEILEAVVAGCSNGEMATRFQITVNTVKHHIASFTAVRLKSDRWPQEIVCAPVIAFVVGNDLKSKYKTFRRKCDFC